MMVGFTDGYVRGYSKSGQKVFSRLMHLEPVAKLTCMASSTVQRPALGLVCGLDISTCAQTLIVFHVKFVNPMNALVLLRVVKLSHGTSIYSYVKACRFSSLDGYINAWRIVLIELCSTCN